MKKIEKVNETSKEIIIVYVEAVLMPNNEIIRNGKSLGFEKDYKTVYKEIKNK